MSSGSTVLTFYDPRTPTVVCTDASSYAIGGVLMQGHGDQLRSGVFCSTQKNTERLRSNMHKSRSAWEQCGNVRDYHVT